MGIEAAIVHRTIAAAPEEAAAQLHETHISWVLLLGDHAYKIKKAVCLDFWDGRCAEERRAMCFQELKLNRRFSPEIYEAVVPVFETDGILTFGEGQHCVDYAVRMRRLSPLHHAPFVLASESMPASTWYQVGYQIGEFQQNIPSIMAQEKVSPLHLHWDWQSLRSQIMMQLGIGIWQQLQQNTMRATLWWKQIAPAINSRAATGAIRDGHGDLHLGNIFLYEQPVFFDCLEFSPELRQMDVWDELAFLLMDLEAHQAVEAAAQVWKGYCQHPETERPDPAIFRYFKLYRAGIRAKVSFLKALQTEDPDKQSEALNETVRYIHLMDKYCWETHSLALNRPQLV